MKILKNILNSVVNVFFTSADPNLFGIGGFVGDILDGGEGKRDSASKKLSKRQQGYADETQLDIDTARSRNPFESAAAKSALATASRRAKQIQKRYANQMGGRASAESMVASQGATQSAIAGATGAIATGAEAQKANEIARLRSEKAGYRGQSASTEQGRIDNIGSGWKHFFTNVLPGVGSALEAGGGLIDAGGATGAAGGAEGGAAAAAGGAELAALSDVNAKENISFIGELQGHRVYKYNFKGHREVHLGVIAQEVLKYKPDCIQLGEPYMKVHYDKLFTKID